MNAMCFFRAFIVWGVIIGVETIHGILRTLLLLPMVGDFRARQISVFTGSVLILGVAYLFSDWIRALSKKQLITVGFMWVLLTVLFEMILGRLILDLPWTRITEDYDLSRGGLLGFGLLFMIAAPSLAQCLRSRSKNRTSDSCSV
jgi:hypothetical protein